MGLILPLLFLGLMASLSPAIITLAIRITAHNRGPEPAPLPPLGHQRLEPDLALEELLDRIGDAPGPAQLILVALELAGQEERVEREPVARR